MTAKTPAAVSHAKPKAPAKKKPTAKETAANTVAKLRQTNLAIPAPSATPSELVMMPLTLIETRSQVRTEFDDESLQELAQDIAARGVLQPILLRPNPGQVNFLVIAGERRLRAARLASLEAIPAIIGEVDDDTASLMQIAENIQRQDLSITDEAAAVRKLYELLENSVTAVAERLHKSKAWVSKRLAASCPNLAWQAKKVLEQGATEDLEIVLTLDKLAALDYWEASKVADKVIQGEAGRQTVRDELERVKAERDERAAKSKQWQEEQNTPEAIAARDSAQAAHEQQQKQRAEKMRLDPSQLCHRVMREAYYEPADRKNLEPDELAVITAHLQGLTDSGRADSMHEGIKELVRMIESDGDYSTLEIAAYVLGQQGRKLDAETFIKEIQDTATALVA